MEFFDQKRHEPAYSTILASFGLEVLDIPTRDVKLSKQKTAKGLKELSLVVRKQVFGIPTRSDTNQAVQLLEMARGLKFCI